MAAIYFCVLGNQVQEAGYSDISKMARFAVSQHYGIFHFCGMAYDTGISCYYISSYICSLSDFRICTYNSRTELLRDSPV